MAYEDRIMRIVAQQKREQEKRRTRGGGGRTLGGDRHPSGGSGGQDSGIRTLRQGSNAAQLQEQIDRKNRRDNVGWRNEQLREQMNRQFTPAPYDPGVIDALRKKKWFDLFERKKKEEDLGQLREQMGRKNRRDDLGWMDEQLQEQMGRSGDPSLSLNVPLPYGEVPGIPEDTPKMIPIPNWIPGQGNTIKRIGETGQYSHPSFEMGTGAAYQVPPSGGGGKIYGGDFFGDPGRIYPDPLETNRPVQQHDFPFTGFEGGRPAGIGYEDLMDKWTGEEDEQPTGASGGMQQWMKNIYDSIRKYGVLPGGGVAKAYGAMHPTFGGSRGGIASLKHAR